MVDTRVAEEYASLFHDMAYHQSRRHIRPRTAPPAAAMHAAMDGGSAVRHRAPPDLSRRRPPPRPNRSYPIGQAHPPLPQRKPEARIAHLLCGAGDTGNARLSPYDCTWFQDRQDMRRPTTANWMLGRPSVGLVAGDVRGVARPASHEPPPAMQRATGPQPNWRPAPAGRVTVEDL